MTQPNPINRSDVQSLPELGGAQVQRFPINSILSFLLFLVYLVLFTGPSIFALTRSPFIMGHKYFFEASAVLVLTVGFFIAKRIMQYWNAAFQYTLMVTVLMAESVTDPEFAKTFFEKLRTFDPQKALDAIKSKGLTDEMVQSVTGAVPPKKEDQ